MKITYVYVDRVWKKEVGPCDPESLGRAWFKNRINRDSQVTIVELDKTVPLWTIPDFKQVAKVRQREWKKLLVAASIVTPVVLWAAWWMASSYESPDMEREKQAEEWLSNPENRKAYNQYMREERGSSD